MSETGLIGFAVALSAAIVMPLMLLSLWARATSLHATIAFVVGLGTAELVLALSGEGPSAPTFARAALCACGAALASGVLASLLFLGRTTARFGFLPILRTGLVLMTAGVGVSHSEISLTGPDPLRGLQLWVALPDDALLIAPSFEQHIELPKVELANGVATVLTGTFGGARSPATTFTPLLGVQADLRPGITAIDLDPGFEHGLMIITGRATLDGTELPAGPLHYLGVGTAGIELAATEPTTMIILGGPPFEDALVMWWNFIGRSHDDIVTARAEWERHDDRFGRVAGHGAARIPAPPLPTTVLKPRRRHPPT